MKQLMPDWRNHLVHDPQICSGQLTAKGTRIPVTVILDNVAEGNAPDRILAAYPTLREEHISAALRYAAELAREEAQLPLRDL